MEFFQRAVGPPGRLAILPGTFNPPTIAHLAIARAALAEADEVLFVLPREFPHKPYAGAGFAGRVQMLRAALAAEPRFSAAATEGGLFIDIARECRAAYGPAVKLAIVCGADAAERIVNWNYGPGRPFAEMLEEFELLVAARAGAYQPPAELRTRIRPLAMAPLDHVSATEVRERIASGRQWEHLVPAAIAPLARDIYPRT